MASQLMNLTDVNEIIIIDSANTRYAVGAEFSVTAITLYAGTVIAF
jgi:hypothetical protein